MLQCCCAELALPLACRVFRHIVGEREEAQDFPGQFLAAYSLSTSLQRSHLEARRCLPASLDAELAPGHLLATCLEGQRLAQAPPLTSSETAGELMYNSA